MLANYLEITYQAYRNLRQVANQVYANKLTHPDNQRPTFEQVCMTVAFDFDNNNQAKVAAALGIKQDRLILDLCLLATGARLESQGK